MQNSVNHAPGLKCKVCPRLLSEVITRREATDVE